MGGGYLPSQVWTGGGTYQVWTGGVPTRSGWGWGVPIFPCLDGGYLPSRGVPTKVGTPRQGRYPLARVGTPLARVGTPPTARVGTPPLEQHSVCLLRGGRYASCVQAGGLTCQVNFGDPRQHYI